MAQLFNLSRLAEALGISKGRVSSMKASGALPAPIRDPETNREVWTRGTLAHMEATRHNHQASPSLASLPEASNPLPIERRVIIEHPYSPGSPMTRSTLLTVYRGPEDSPIILCQPLSGGGTVTNHPEIFRNQHGYEERIDSDSEAIPLIQEAMTALNLPDPYSARWLVIGPHPDSRSLDSRGILEVIVETLTSRLPYQRDWPFTVTWHLLPGTAVSARMGQQIGVMPRRIRSAPVAEAWAASDWAEDFTVQVDVDEHLEMAQMVSTLFAAVPNLPILTWLLKQRLPERSTVEELPDRYDMMFAQVPEHTRGQPRPLLPAIPPVAVTTPKPDVVETLSASSASKQPLSQTDKNGIISAIKSEMHAAQHLLDFDYAPSTRREPLIRAALRHAIGIGASEIHDLSDWKIHYSPAPDYYVRATSPSRIPENAANKPLTPQPDQRPTATPGIPPEYQRVLATITSTETGEKLPSYHFELPGPDEPSGQIVAGVPARYTHSMFDGTATVLLMVPSLESNLAPSPEDWANWEAISVFQQTQDAPIWIEIGSHSYAMPLSINAPFTTGYGGTGPTNTTQAITQFLEWTHQRPLSDDEQTIVRSRITQDKSAIVTIHHDHFPAL